MLTLVISSLFGLFHALLPQVFGGIGKWFQDKHEYKMAELMYKNAAGERQLRMNELIEHDTSREYIELIRLANKPTGIRWVDSAAGIARPFIAFSVLVSFIGLCGYIVSHPLLPAFVVTTVFETASAILGYVVTFYFGRREAQKNAQ